MNRLQMYVDGCPHWVKASSRACRISLLALIPIGSLSPCGMRILDAYGVRAPAADLMLVSVMALPFVGIFLWSFLGERFWDWAIARFAIVRFVRRWSLEHAQTRRKELTGLIEKYVLGNVKSQGSD